MVSREDERIFLVKTRRKTPLSSGRRNENRKKINLEEIKIMAKKYCYLFTEGNAKMREILGGKGANLAEMTNIGLPVFNDVAVIGKSFLAI